MRIVSLNLWNINRDWLKRRDIIESFLFDADPDLVLLQEVSPNGLPSRPQFEDFSKRLRCREHSVYRKSGLWKDREEGLAILSVAPISDVTSIALPIAARDMPRQLLACCVDVGGRKLRVANTHLAFALDADVSRTAQVEECLAHLRRLTLTATYPLVFAGDFNSVPDSSAIERILSDAIGFQDAFVKLNKLPNTFTFCASNPMVDPDLGANRWIDYMFVSRDVRVTHAQRVLDHSNSEGCWASDHFGLLAEIQF
jgi:endonuclease/exonuclease/phosphatase family metal-dependent hydrolase